MMYKKIDSATASVANQNQRFKSFLKLRCCHPTSDLVNLF